MRGIVDIPLWRAAGLEKNAHHYSVAGCGLANGTVKGCGGLVLGR